MGWTVPHTWAVADSLLASDLNTWVRDNTQYNLDTIRATNAHASSVTLWTNSTGGLGPSGTASTTTQQVAANGSPMQLFNFVKRQNDTDISVIGYLMAYSQTTGAQNFSYTFNGQNPSLFTSFWWNQTQDYHNIDVGATELAVPAGVYDIRCMVIAPLSSGHTITMDGNASWDITVLERTLN